MSKDRGRQQPAGYCVRNTCSVCYHTTAVVSLYPVSTLEINRTYSKVYISSTAHLTKRNSKPLKCHCNGKLSSFNCNRTTFPHEA